MLPLLPHQSHGGATGLLALWQGWAESRYRPTPRRSWLVGGSLILNWTDPGPPRGRVTGKRSGLVVRAPYPIPQQAWFLVIHLFIHSLIQMIFIEHLVLDFRILVLVSHRTGSTQSVGGGSCNVTCTVMEEALVSWSREDP